MADPLLLYSIAALGGTLAGSALILPRMRRIPRLLPSTSRSGPRAAVIVAARDEAATIGPALDSLVSQLDDDLQIVLVNDRSTDATGQIMDAVAASSRGVEVHHVAALPPGWLGKNHALAVGAAAATRQSDPPQFLLFTDADVHFTPGGIRGAIAHADALELDHLAGAPLVHTSSWPLAGQITAFGVLFGLFTRPWSVPNPRSSAHVGIGALNLVRRCAYERAGGHAAIAMRIDDDLRLGKAVKGAGGRSAFAFASEIASLTWYPSLGSMLRGLHKNAFAGIDYSLGIAVAATIVLILAFLVPFAIAVLPAHVTGATAGVRALSGAAALLQVAGAAESARSAELPRSTALFFPFGVGLFLVVLWRSALGALLTGRVVWRRTSYSIAELKRASPASFPPVDSTDGR